MTFNVFPAATALNVVKRTVVFHANAAGVTASMNMTQAERFWAAAYPVRYITLADLSDCTEVRFMSVVTAHSISVNTPLLRLRYYTSWSATHANYLQLGLTQHVDLSLFTGTANTLQDTGWLDLALGARAEGTALALCELGGNGSADPSIGHTQAWFR